MFVGDQAQRGTKQVHHGFLLRIQWLGTPFVAGPLFARSLRPLFDQADQGIAFVPDLTGLETADLRQPRGILGHAPAQLDDYLVFQYPFARHIAFTRPRLAPGGQLLQHHQLSAAQVLPAFGPFPHVLWVWKIGVRVDQGGEVGRQPLQALAVEQVSAHMQVDLTQVDDIVQRIALLLLVEWAL